MKLTHPDTEQIITTDEERAHMYLSQGWTPEDDQDPDQDRGPDDTESN